MAAFRAATIVVAFAARMSPVAATPEAASFSGTAKVAAVEFRISRSTQVVVR